MDENVELSYVGLKSEKRTTNDKISVIQANMKAAQDRQRSYASLKQRTYNIKERDLVILKVSPWMGKLSPRYVGPFKLIKIVSNQAFKLELLDMVSNIITY